MSADIRLPAERDVLIEAGIEYYPTTHGNTAAPGSVVAVRRADVERLMRERDEALDAERNWRASGERRYHRMVEALGSNPGSVDVAIDMLCKRAVAWTASVNVPAGLPLAVGLNALSEEIHGLNRKWWYDGDDALTRNKGELLMLVVTEVAEAMEGERKGLMDDKLPHRPMAEVELVDAIVRILDYAGAYGYDLDGAFREKVAFNTSRADHQAEAKKIATGNPLECKAAHTLRRLASKGGDR